MSKEINTAAAVDYNTLPAIKVTCWIDEKNLSSSQNHGGYESVYERVYVSAVSEAGTGSETCLFAGKSNGKPMKNFNKAATFIIPKECR